MFSWSKCGYHVELNSIIAREHYIRPALRKADQKELWLRRKKAVIRGLGNSCTQIKDENKRLASTLRKNSGYSSVPFECVTDTLRWASAQNNWELMNNHELSSPNEIYTVKFYEAALIHKYIN